MGVPLLGEEVFGWPEFQALVKRLGFPDMGKVLGFCLDLHLEEKVSTYIYYQDQTSVRRTLVEQAQVVYHWREHLAFANQLGIPLGLRVRSLHYDLRASSPVEYTLCVSAEDTERPAQAQDTSWRDKEPLL